MCILLVFLMSQLMVCAGFEQGSSYSGDLEDAQRSIPQGTLWAVCVSSIVCILLAHPDITSVADWALKIKYIILCIICTAPFDVLLPPV